MIDHLHIKNFLAFPELVVPELKLINLVAGRNGVGKTALLEALLIYRSHSSFSTSRVATHRKLGDQRDTTTLPKFFNRLASKSNPSPEIKINDLTLRLDGETSSFDAVLDNEEHERLANRKVDLIRASSPYKRLDELWSSIVLTPLEFDVVDVLSNSLSLSVRRISVTSDEVKILLGDMDQPVNLETLGDGVKRVLLIALSLVNAKGSLLLIDEIETHLHHTVIRKLWKIIFEYAVKWNIQVVATTHSQDAIREFWYEAAEKEAYQEASQVLRLQLSREGKHEVIQFPFPLLDSALEMEMEIR